MIVLTEGLTANDEEVSEKFFQFLKPSIKTGDLSHIFKLIDCKLTFQNNYFARLPYLIVVATLKILPDPALLAEYLRDHVMENLKLLLGEEEVKPVVTHEELFLFRLTVEIS